MFKNYSLEEADIIAILPSPLNMIVVLIEHFQQQQQAKAQTIQDQANQNAARMLAEKKQKQLQESAISAMKMQERLAETPMSALDHAQSELQRKVALLEQNVSTDEKFNIKEKISRE